MHPWHEAYGTFSKPPVTPEGWWPNGSMVTSMRVPKHMGKSTVIGWAVFQDVDEEKRKVYGVWVATKIGYHFGWPRSYFTGVDPAKDWKWVGRVPIISATFADCFEVLADAFENEHSCFLHR